jgi:hypothetical protein
VPDLDGDFPDRLLTPFPVWVLGVNAQEANEVSAAQPRWRERGAVQATGNSAGWRR